MSPDINGTMTSVLLVFAAFLFLSSGSNFGKRSEFATALPVLSRSLECPVKFTPHPPVSRFLESNEHQLNEHNGRLSTLGLSRIAGGDPSGPELAKYLGTVSNGTSYCTGAIVGPRLMLTSAFCAAITTKVFVGSIFQGTGTEIEIEEKIPDSRYDNETDVSEYDFALIKLSEDVPDGRYMKISIDSNRPSAGFVRVAGYGRLSPNNNNIDVRLNQVDLPVYSNDKCSKEFSRPSSLFFCAGYEDGECDVCAGDAGAPVFVYDGEGIPLIVGIVNSPSCAQRAHNIPFLRTAQYQPLLESAGLQEGTDLIGPSPPPSSSAQPSATPPATPSETSFSIATATPSSTPSVTPSATSPATPSSEPSATPAVGPSTRAPDQPSTEPSISDVEIPTTSGGISMLVLIGILAGSIIVLLTVAVCILFWRRRS